MPSTTHAGLHFVRCIKPNAALKPNAFESHLTLHQLRCCGVLEVARIARAGFPTRYTHAQFAERYAILLPDHQLHGAAGAEVRGVGNGIAQQLHSRWYSCCELQCILQ